MKLKKSFSVSFLLFFVFFLSLFSFGCSTTLSLVPGADDAKISGIYNEYYNLGEGYFNLGDYKNAEKFYKQAMKNKNNYWGAYYKLGKCYAYQNDWHNALEVYVTLLERDPDNNSIKSALAYIYLMQNDYDNSSKLYKELIDNEPNNKEFLENYIALLLNQSEVLDSNKDEIISKLNLLQENYSDDENAKKLQKKYDELTKNNNADSTQEDLLEE